MKTITLHYAIEKQFPEEEILRLIQEHPEQVSEHILSGGCRPYIASAYHNVLHVACANNLPYTVIHALVQEYPDAASLSGGFLLGRLPEEYLFQDYFGCEGGFHCLNDRAYYGLQGYVKTANQLGPGYPWSDFWRKVSLLVVARRWKQLPEVLLCSGRDCYQDPLLLVLMADAWTPKIYGQSRRKGWHSRLRSFLTEMIDRMLPIAPTYSSVLLHRAICFRAPPPSGKGSPENKQNTKHIANMHMISAEVILNLAEKTPASLTRCCPELQCLTPVALAAERGRDLDLIFELLRVNPLVCNVTNR